MSFDDLVSLLIAIVAMLFMVVTSIKAERRTKREERYEEEDDEQVVRQPKAKPKVVTPPATPVRQPRVAENYQFQPKMDSFTQKTNIDDQHLTIHLRPENELVSDAFRDSEGVVLTRKKKQNIQDLIKSLPQEKLLFLSYEVFHVPVSKRKSPFPWNG
ncbi:MAG: hypothetical protein JSR37_00110 [Verrucomicrobia bacterium]|nr:hypothetical protein [Verrucomicrobiota bacterium]MBS0638145.1 hypothetical protein [Verrucomicrobiota bacterium]